MSPIKISVCIPTFNRADLLDQTLQSVAAQKELPYEVIVTDNNSTDKTDEVGHYYAKKYGFTYVKNKENLGMIGNWNKAISLAKGDYICLLHSDDLISPDWHATWQDTIQKHTADFYTSAIAIINSANEAQFTAHIFDENVYLEQPHVMEAFLRRKAPMIAPSGASIYAKKIFKEIGLYKEEHKTEADVPHFLKVASTYDVYYHNRIVFCWRSHEAQTFDKEKQKKTVTAELNRLDNYFSLVAEFYKKNYKNDPEKRLLVQTHAFMTLTAINLYVAKLKFNKVIGAYRIAHRHFPDLFTKASDWPLFFSIQAALVKRAIAGKKMSKDDKKSLEWLKRIEIKKY
ncbi:MAG: hypothetical protein RI947_679 [Candidatus Parcubacteria bacterium]|jgi:glycosyltransferase involved in cell wall biosynthesis